MEYSEKYFEMTDAARVKPSAEYEAGEDREAKEPVEMKEFKNINVMRALLKRLHARAHGGGESQDEKIGLLVLGGALMGVRSAGMLLALEKLGITADKFDGMWGVSAGAANLAYYGIGKVVEGIKIYFNKLAKRKNEQGLIHPLNIRRPIHLDELTNVMEGSGQDSLDKQALAALGDKFTVVVTNATERKVEYIAIDKWDDPVETMRASMSIPGLTESVMHDGMEYVDGAAIDKIPIEKMQEHFHHVLILSNNGFEEMNNNKAPAWLAWLQDNLFIRRVPPKVRRFIRREKKVFGKEYGSFKKIFEKGLKNSDEFQVMAIEPSESEKEVDYMKHRDPHHSVGAAIDSYAHTIAVLRESFEEAAQGDQGLEAFVEEMFAKEKVPSYDAIANELLKRQHDA